MLSTPANLFGRFIDQESSFPDKPAVIIQARSTQTAVSYSELRFHSLCAAHHLHEKGARKGEVVAIMLPHAFDSFYYFLGALALGAVPAFFPPPTPKLTVEYFWNSHGGLFDINKITKIVASGSHFDLLCQHSREPKSLIDPGEFNRNTPLTYSGNAAQDSIAFLQHSSGTTGLKKGVMLSQHAVLDQLNVYRKAIGFGSEDIVASWLPLYHDMELITSLLLPLTSGATLVAIDPFIWTSYPPLLLEAMEAHRATFCWQPNFAFNLLAKTKRRDYDLHSVRALINCSEPCYPKTHEHFSEAFRESGIDTKKIQVCYAMAETVFAVSQTVGGRAPVLARPESSSANREFISCGVPLEGAQIRILDDQGRGCADGRVGKIHLSCRFMFDGYYNRPDITSEKIVDGWYSTGDVGFMRNGELFVISRTDDVIVAHGKNYHATDLETIVDGYKGVKSGRRIAVSDFNNAFGTNDIVMLVEQDPTADDVDASILLGYLREMSGAPFSSVQIVPDGWIVKTTSGKLNRGENKKKLSKLAGPTGEH